jgi:hypothetical protein
MSSGPRNVTSVTSNEPPAFLQQSLNQATTGNLGRYWSDMSGETGLRPNELNTNASHLVNNTLQGDYLNPDSNPYLQGTFNRAADLTRGRLDSEFAGAGRNLGAAQPARSEELQTLASNIYGGNYQAERDRQQSALGQAQGFDPLNQYINRIAAIVPGAGGVTTSTQPVFKTGLF